MRWEILDAWREAAEECGIPKIEEFNRGDNFGNAYFHMNQKRGRALERHEGVAAAGARARPNLTVVTERARDPGAVRQATTDAARHRHRLSRSRAGRRHVAARARR